MCSGITWPPSGTRAASNRSEIIAPIYDDDGEIDDILTVNINGEIIEDEEAAMESSDWTSEVISTMTSRSTIRLKARLARRWLPMSRGRWR